jgi:adenylate kinase family enzyme
VNLLLLGPQGAGKGTQAKRIAEAYDIPHVSTGDMFRAAIAEGSELGQTVQGILARGDLVPDDVTIAMIQHRLATAERLASRSMRFSSSTCPTMLRQRACSSVRKPRTVPTTRPT